MKRVKFFLAILFIIFLFNLLASYASAEDGGVIDFILQRGEDFYKQGNIEEAKQEFIKVLLVEPGNKTAKNYLQEIGLQTKETTSKTEDVEHKQELKSLQEAQKNLQAKDSQIRQLEDELRKQIEALTQELQAKIAELNLQKETSANILLDKDKTLSVQQNYIWELETKLKSADTELEEFNKDLLTKDSEIKELQAQLQSTNLNLDASRKESQIKNEQIKLLQDNLDAKCKEIITLTNELNLKKEEHNQALRDLQTKLESAVKSLEQSYQNLSDKDSQTKQLEDSLKSLEESFQSKNKQVETLTQELQAKTTELNLQKEISAKILVDKDKVSSDQVKHIWELETKLKSADTELEEFNKDLLTKDSEIKELQDKLDSRTKELISITDDFKTHKQEFTQALNQKDKILEEKKEETTKSLQIKDNQINELTNTLNTLENTSADKDKALAQAQKELQDVQVSLQQTLEESQAKLNELHSSVAQRALEDELKTARLRDTMDRLQKSLESVPDEYKAKIELAQRGLVITFSADILFNSGSADIIPEGKSTLDNISKVLKNITADNQLVIEGHTDNVPIKYSRWKSNWELSNARALSVLHYFIYELGLEPQNFSTKGYGEFKPIGDNSTDEGRKQNRRVEIVIQPF